AGRRAARVRLGEAGHRGRLRRDAARREGLRGGPRRARGAPRERLPGDQPRHGPPDRPPRPRRRHDPRPALGALRGRPVRRARGGERVHDRAHDPDVPPALDARRGERRRDGDGGGVAEPEADGAVAGGSLSSPWHGGGAMRTRTLTRSLLITAAAAWLAVAGAQGQRACEAVGGTATIAQWSEPGNLNPLIFPTTYDENVQELVFARLIRPTETRSFEPDMAESWEVSDDARTLTFRLRAGLTSHAGRPVWGRDVAFTFSAMARPARPGGRFAEVSSREAAEAYNAGEADSGSGIRVIDDRTVSFTTVEPYAPFLPVIGGVFILPEHVYGAVDIASWQQDATNREPVGSGPFVFQQWRPGEFIELTAFDGYWEGRPCLDRLIVRFGDQNTMLAALLSGEVDAAPVPVDGASSVASHPDLELHVVDALSFQYIGTNLRNPMLADPAVRQAIALAVNRDAMVTGLLQGYGSKLDTIFPTNHW